jgi:predicted NBD/HSP70 family sugar kinase
MPRSSAVRPEEIRRHNLSLLLNEIHTRGELSRTDLTARLGLNRSTIGALVSDLVELGLVSEYIPARGDRAGRPSHVVAPRPDGPWVLAAEVQVERILVASVGLGGRVHARVETPVDVNAATPAMLASQIAREATRLADAMPPGATLLGTGVSVPGTVRRRDGLVEHAPNLGWREVAFADILSAQLDYGVDVLVGNDANLGALAEHQRGAARGLDNVIFLNGSVGVGGGVIADGAGLQGTDGFAGEIGHMMLNPDGPSCHCGSSGCIETYIGEHALLRAAGVTEGFGPATTAAVLAAAEAGEPLALNAVNQVSLWLGRTLANLVNVFNPEAVIVGGSLAGVVRLGRAVVEAELGRRAMAAARAAVRLLPPGLGSESSLLGAAELAFQSLLAAPDAAVSAPTSRLAN